MKLRTLRKVIFSSRKSRQAAMRRRLIRFLEGPQVWTTPGPDILIAEQPTFAPMKVFVGGSQPVRIGRYCSINETVTFMAGGNHPFDAVTTFFFYWAMGEGEPERATDSDKQHPITIGSDVWIGREALVMDRVAVGHGAVIAARAVVTKDVQPYEMVGGMPAHHLGWRFDEQTRHELLKIAWWDWPVEKVLAHRTQLYGRGDGVVDFIARHGGKVDAMTSAEQCEICD